MKITWFLIIVAALAVIASIVTMRFFNSSSRRFAIESGLYVIYLLGGVLLGAVPFDRKNIRAVWGRAVFALSALILVFIGASELLRHYRIWVLSSGAEYGFSHTLSVLRGVVLGFLLTLVFSGELAGRKLPRRTNA